MTAATTSDGHRPLRIAILVKQIPAVSEMRLDTDSRLQRAGLHTEMNAYCRRAVAKATEIAAADIGLVADWREVVDALAARMEAAGER